MDSNLAETKNVVRTSLNGARWPTPDVERDAACPRTLVAVPAHKHSYGMPWPAVDSAAASTLAVRTRLSLVGRSLLVMTFIHDAVTLVEHWPGQLALLDLQRGLSEHAAIPILITNIIVLVASALAIVGDQYISFAVGGISILFLFQVFGYNLPHNRDLFLDMPHIILMHSVLILYLANADSSLSGRRKIPAHRVGGLLSLSYLALALALALYPWAHLVFSWTRLVLAVTGLATLAAIACKSRGAVACLLAVLTAANMYCNCWWRLRATHPRRDALRFNYAHASSITGMLLLLASGFDTFFEENPDGLLTTMEQ